MSNRKYENSVKKEKRSFKEYRKHLFKALIWFAVAGVTFFVLPEYVFAPLNTFLKGFMAEKIASSITFFSQMFVVFLGTLSGIAHSIAAHKAKKDLYKAQDETSDIVDSIVSENEDLLKKVDELEKSKSKTSSVTRTNTRSNNYQKANVAYEEEKPKVKRYTL